MKKIPIALLLIFLVALAAVPSGASPPAPNRVVVLTLRYANASFSFEDAHLVEGEFIANPSTGAYEVRVLNARGEVQYRTSFDVDFRTYGAADPSWFDDSGNQVFFPTPRPTQTEGSFLFELPLYDDLATGQVVKNEKTLLSFPLDQFALCNSNAICEPAKNENADTCPQDCTLRANASQIQTGQSAAPATPLATGSKDANVTVMLGIAVGVLAVLGLWFWIQKAKNAPKPAKTERKH